MKVSDQLTDALAELEGKTPDEIAKIMLRRGTKGRPGTTQKCPLAVFFNAVHTGKFVIGRQFIMRTSGKAVEKAKTPKNLADFVRRFDIGKYPELIAMPPRCLIKDPRKGPRRGKPHKRPYKHREMVNHFAKDVGRFTQ